MAAASYSWAINQWVHLRVEWDDSAAVASQQRIYVNGTPMVCAPGPDYNAALLALGNNAEFWLGDINNGAPEHGAGIYDEFYIFGGYSFDLTDLLGGLGSLPF